MCRTARISDATKFITRSLKTISDQSFYVIFQDVKVNTQGEIKQTWLS